MTHNPVITEAMREAGAAHIGGGSTFDHEERLEMAEEIYLAMHRTNPVVDVEGMVERVARAIHEARFKKPGLEYQPWSMDESDHEYCNRLVRAAIEALNSQGGV